MTAPNQAAPTFYYRPDQQFRAAGVILVLALAILVLSPTAGWRFLALPVAAPVLIWGSYELLRRRSCICLQPSQIVILRPASIRPRLVIAYQHIGAALAWRRNDRIGIVYYVPRPPFEGEADPRPPIRRVLITEPLAQRDTLLALLKKRLNDYNAASTPDAQYPKLPATTAEHYLRAFRFRRMLRTGLILLFSPILIFLVVRLTFSALDVLGIFQ